MEEREIEDRANDSVTDDLENEESSACNESAEDDKSMWVLQRPKERGDEESKGGEEEGEEEENKIVPLLWDGMGEGRDTRGWGGGSRQ